MRNTCTKGAAALAAVAVIAAAAFPAGSEAAAAQCPDGIISYWTFNDGTAADSLGANNGVLQGATPVIDGCSCLQILQLKPGGNAGERKKGRTPETLSAFADRTGWARDVPRPPR